MLLSPSPSFRSTEDPASIVRCPACAQPPRLHPVGDGDAIARCACGEYPLAEGVLVTQRGRLHERLLDAVRHGDTGAARAILLDNHRRNARLLEMLGMRLTFQRYVRHRALAAMVDQLRLQPLLGRLAPRAVFARIAAAAQWNTYIRHRFVQPTMMGVIALLGLVVRDRSDDPRAHDDGMILDAPCGMGHLSFLLGKLVPQRRIVCMDRSSPFVYATRRFFAPDAGAAIVHDMNGPLPLADGSFETILCSDAFHYVENRRELAREFVRVLRDDGVIVLAHVHNRLHRTPYAGYPLSPAEYAGLFPGCAVRVLPEPLLVDAYVNAAPVDLSKPTALAEAERHRYLYVIAAKSEHLLQRPVPPVRQRLLATARNPRVNGLYRAIHGRDGIVFERRLPAGLEAEYADYDYLLPPRVEVPASSVHRFNGHVRFDNERELLERHVLIDVPDDF